MKFKPIEIMKKLLMLLVFFPMVVFGQSAVLHYYYGSNEMMGAEMLMRITGTESTYLGGGFSGALDKTQAVGEWRSGKMATYEKELKTSETKEKWCSLYVTNSFGYVGRILVTYKAGLAVYDNKFNFEGENPSTLEPYLYNKNDKVMYGAMAGIGGVYQLSEDYGVQASFDSFNGATLGFNVIFD